MFGIQLGDFKIEFVGLLTKKKILIIEFVGLNLVLNFLTHLTKSHNLLDYF